MMKLNIKTTIVGVIMLTLGLGMGWLIFSGTEVESAAHNHDAEDPAVWTCSMHPQIRQNEFGACPICGMDLIELSTESDSDPLAISMSENAMKLANIETVIVSKTETTKQIRLTGKVQADERRVFSQSSHIPGRVERLSINFTGEFVRKGSPIAFIYSPDLVTAQEELFEAYRIKDTQPELFAAAKNKLKNWKLTEAQIDNIINSGKAQQDFPVLSDLSGYVTKKMIKLGDHLMAGSAIYEIADLSKVWVLFDVYETDLAWLKRGSKIDFTIASLPGNNLSGIVSYIDPVINPKTRVAQARIEFSNQDGKLKPEMFATGTLSSDGGVSIILPKSAVMWTGKRSVVYVKKTNNNGVSFAMREVIIGPDFGDSYKIISGIAEGEEVAINGTFSIDAAAQLAGKPSMMSIIEEPVNEASVELSDPAASQALIPLYNRYFDLKDALVSDNFTESQKFGTLLLDVSSSIDSDKFGSKSKALWQGYHSEIASSLEHIEHISTIEEARTLFSDLSNVLVEIAKSFGTSDQGIYVQHCPMANKDRGGDWLSLSTEIKNPYFGSSMLSCGDVTHEIYLVKN